MGTRDQLLDEAEFLFARSSVAGVTTREITEAAGQRNTSAISYHFGSREGLLLELLARRGGPIDAARGRCRSELDEVPPLRDLVACLVVPYCEMLSSPRGRSYLRIVAQLRGRFANWKVESDAATSQHLASVLGEIEARASFAPSVGEERTMALITVITSATAERARRIDDEQQPALAHAEFVANLTDMCTALMGG